MQGSRADEDATVCCTTVKPRPSSHEGVGVTGSVVTTAISPYEGITGTVRVAIAGRPPHEGVELPRIIRTSVVAQERAICRGTIDTCPSTDTKHVSRCG